LQPPAREVAGATVELLALKKTYYFPTALDDEDL
jgi:hypothetical protein